MRTQLVLAVLVLASSLACRERKAEPLQAVASAPAPPVPWTSAFQREAVLVADEIVIEGPPGLIEHVVLRADVETNVYTTKTIPQGLLQELVARPEAGVEVRGQIDAWSLAAFRRITVLERPGDVPVSVRASGSAYWAAGDGSGEKRDDQLSFQGVRGR